MKLKKIMLLLCLLALGNGKVYSQLVTHDPLTFLEQLYAATNTLHGSQGISNVLEHARHIQEELKTVTATVENYRKIDKTRRLIEETARVYASNIQQLSRDRNFTPEEYAAIMAGYARLLEENLDILDDLWLYAFPSNDKFSSSERLEKISQCYDKARKMKTLLDYYTSQHIQLSLMRAQNKAARAAVARLYGLR